MQPNVLLLLVDAMRADRAWGAERSCVTPVLDSLIKQSTYFRNAFSVASMTTCCTASILTGTYPFEHGIRSLGDHRLRRDLSTLAEAFREAGYYTWAEVTGPLLPQVGLNRGFEAYGHRDYGQTLDTDWPQEWLARLARYPQPWFGLLHLWELHHPRRVTPAFNHERYGRHVYDRAVSSLDNQLGRLLEALPDNLVLILTGDHGEYVAPAGQASLAARVKRPFKWIKRRIPGARELKRFTPALFSAMDRLSGQEKHLYYQWLGHGFHVYDYLVSVPLMFHAPGIFPAGHVVDHLASHVDLLPTLRAAFELPAAPPRAGINLLPLTQDGGQDASGRTLYLEASGGRILPQPVQWLGAIRTGRYKYVRGLSSDAVPEELYDLQQDPAEQHNLAGQRPDLAAEYRQVLGHILASASQPETEEETGYTPAELEALQEQLRRLGYVD